MLHSPFPKEIIVSMNEVEELEVKVSYLEVQNSELNEMVIALSKECDLMRKEISVLEKRIEDLVDQLGPERPNRRPPHY